MAVTGRWAGLGLTHILNGDVSFADPVSLILLTNSYTPDIENDEFYDPGGSGIGQDEVANGNGYTTGGESLSSVVAALVDDAAAPAHATDTAYLVGDMVRPASPNGHVYQCIVAGTSDSSPPTWPTNRGEDVTDNTATWQEAGSSFVNVSADSPIQWTSSSITARYGAIIADGSTPGTDDYVLIVVDFGQDEESDAGTFEINLHAVVGAAGIKVET